MKPAFVGLIVTTQGVRMLYTDGDQRPYRWYHRLKFWWVGRTLKFLKKFVGPDLIGL